MRQSLGLIPTRMKVIWLSNPAKLNYPVSWALRQNLVIKEAVLDLCDCCLEGTLSLKKATDLVSRHPRVFPKWRLPGIVALVQLFN
jgi:hypothetical protein